MSDTDFIDEIQSEARASFDLRDRLRGASKLTKEVSIYTDAVAGKDLGGAEPERNQFGIVTGKRRWGVYGELDELKDELEGLKVQDKPDEDEVKRVVDEITKAKKKIPAILKRLEKSALVFTLTTIPDVIKRDVRRKAKLAAGIKGKGIEGHEEEYLLEHGPLIVAASVTSWKDNQTGDILGELAVEDAKILRDELPNGQWEKLDAAVVELSFQSQIGNAATDSADF